MCGTPQTVAREARRRKEREMNKPIPLYTFCGSKMDLNNFDAEGVTIAQIARGLGNLCRYNGQVRSFYSVAEHSILLCHYFKDKGCSVEMQQFALMHDASEAFIGDVVYHLKPMIPGFKVMEENILEEIFGKFSIYPDTDEEDALHKADRAICIDEMYHLCAAVDPILFENGHQPLHVQPVPLTPKAAITAFIVEAKRLKLC